MWTIIAGTIHHDGPDKSGIAEPRADTFVDALYALWVASDDCGHAQVIAVVEQLEELLICPGGTLLCPQIIENQQLGLAHLGEELVINLCRGWCKGCP